ncbi:MAG: hypothetical protein HQK88_09375 [Nitrospirae bacterium]|nr:hypothetical protein [Nitrospirota bacterium]MBF0534122.1 hypothetical protein [Nitrospirota bacterium]MBF0617009.1 hypothetical protein [Nitrospirota bacterium]
MQIYARNITNSLYKSLTKTEAIENALESYLCPMQMFLELTSNGWSVGAFKILKHDLNVKRIFLTKLTIKYLTNIYETLNITQNVSLTNDSYNTLEASANSDSDDKHADSSGTGKEMTFGENLLSIPLFTVGVMYAVVLNAKRVLNVTFRKPPDA